MFEIKSWKRADFGDLICGRRMSSEEESN